MGRFRIPKMAIIMLALIVLGLGLVRWTGLERSHPSRLEIGFRDFVAPLQSGVMIVMQTFSDFFVSLAECRDVYHENERLRAEIKELTYENNCLQEQRLENLRLKKLLEFKKQMEDTYEMVSAKVIGRNPSNWYHTLIIDKGRADGIKENMVVINQRGLIGRIIKLSRHTAEVLTILDGASAVGVLIQETRVPGVVESALDGSGLLEIFHLSSDVPINKGQVIITSGYGEIFPKGLRVGKVRKVISDPNGLVKKAIVKPFVDFDRLEEALVITNVL